MTFIISRTKVECAGLCLSMMSNGCYGFQWMKQKVGDRYVCKLFKKTEDLCSDSGSDDQIEVYIAGDHVIPTCGKTFDRILSM